MSYKIITHNGKAHMDELIGSALLAIYKQDEPESIERVDSQDAAALVRQGNTVKDTWFIDCGMVCDLNLGFCDHHQDKALDSAALILFNEFFPELEGTELHEYVKLVSRVDTGGPMSLDDFDSVSESRTYLTFSQAILLRAFERDPLSILRIFIEGLEDKISFEKDKTQAAEWLKQEGNIGIQEIAGLNIIRYLVKPPSELVSPLRSAIGRVVDENDASAILSFDDKLEGVLTYYRTDFGHDSVDFSQCSPAETVFNHPGGFLMKFKPHNNEEWIELLKQAAVKK